MHYIQATLIPSSCYCVKSVSHVIACLEIPCSIYTTETNVHVQYSREEYSDKFQDVVIPAGEIIHRTVTKLRWGYHCRKRDRIKMLQFY
jgi:hypothetical protein